MLLRSFALVLVLVLVSRLVAACSSASSGSAPPSRTTAVGAYTVETLAEGDNFVALATTARTDDALTVTFERASRTARIETRYAPARSVPLESFPEDVDAANQRVADPLAIGYIKASGASSSKAKVPDPPWSVCANPCFEACDAQLPDAVHNAACRFGCTNGCTTPR